MAIPDMPSFETHVLHRLQFYAKARLRCEDLSPREMEFSLERVADELVVTAFYSALGQELPKKTFTLEVAYPKSWWDHFKLRWFPLWAKHRWPVLYGKTTKTVELDGHVLYPEVVIPKYRDDFRIRKSPVLEVNS